MTKGLKQAAQEALADSKPALPPVKMTDEARLALSNHVRRWTGWPNARVIIGKPDHESPWARVDTVERTITVNIDELILNPNRVLLTVTPFRLRQEAIITGALLHEAGHARHSRWLPATPEEAAVKPALYSDGTAPTEQVVALARLVEEARVEGMMARNAHHIGADGLAWTMRASAAKLIPFTTMSTDPDQAILDLISSWVLRAGRQIAYAHHVPSYNMRMWTHNFTSLLTTALASHLEQFEDDSDDLFEDFGDDQPENPKHVVNARLDAQHIVRLLRSMVCSDSSEAALNASGDPFAADTSPFMLDTAREILTLLFPETNPDETDESAPMPGAGCSADPGDGADPESESEAGDDGEGDESGEGGEGNTEPEDEGSGDEPGAGDSGPDEDSDESGDSDADPSGSDGDGDEDDSPGDDGSDAEADAEAETQAEALSDLMKALAQMEAASQDDTEEETQAEADGPPSMGAGNEAGDGRMGEWRQPARDERDVQRGAEQFLRSMIDPSETSKVSLTDSPSATVDGAALAAWKASGEIKAPHFFRRTRRITEASPPVKIAVLVDVSISMSELQHPSALLSWSLASAALDLRNFAGRGQQIESCLIHWGTRADVIQANGAPLPGILDAPCNQGTSAMNRALELVEEQIPGFFDLSDTPVNRLLVQFTDWQLAPHSIEEPIARALAAGVNMLSVVPKDYSSKWGALDDVLRKAKVQRGRTHLLRYNPMFPTQVWDQAAEMLNGTTPAPFAGF